jgi:hypothetical protein
VADRFHRRRLEDCGPGWLCHFPRSQKSDCGREHLRNVENLQAEAALERGDEFHSSSFTGQVALGMVLRSNRLFILAIG